MAVLNKLALASVCVFVLMLGAVWVSHFNHRALAQIALEE